MSDFDNEKTGGQERPDYYQPNQNEGQTYYTPPQNEQADNNTTYHYSYAGKAQENQESYSNASNYSSGNGNYYQPPQNDNKQNAENGNSPKPPKKKPSAGKIVAIILVICAFVAAVGIVLSTAGVIDNSKNSQNNSTPSQSQDSGSDVKTNDSNSVQTKDSSGNLTVAGVAKKVLDSCVGITVYSEKQASYNYFYNYGNNDGNNSSNSDPEKSGEGSGIIMSEKNGKTYILTCAHVISEGTKFTVTLNNKKEYDASMVAYDSQTDIGVLSINATGLQVAEFANSDNLAVGEQVIAIGCPGGLEFMNSLTSGYISALDRPISSNIGYDNKCIQVDAAINPGNSGGALFNMQGQVVGVNSSKIAATEYEGMGFAVPSDTAIATANSLIKSGYVEGRAKLGITYLPLTKYSNYSAILSALEEKGYKNAQGTMVINSVDGSSDLASKDVKQYDMIVAINGKTMTSTDVLTSVLADSKPGDTVKLTIARIENNSIKTSTVECKLMESKGDSSSQSNSSGE